jgi:hypothetical protein
MVFSKGHYSNINCVHVPSGLGQTQATFDIAMGQVSGRRSSNTAPSIDHVLNKVDTWVASQFLASDAGNGNKRERSQLKGRPYKLNTKYLQGRIKDKITM